MVQRGKYFILLVDYNDDIDKTIVSTVERVEKDGFVLCDTVKEAVLFNTRREAWTEIKKCEDFMSFNPVVAYSGQQR